MFVTVHDKILKQILSYKSLSLVLRGIVNLYHEATIDDTVIHQSNMQTGTHACYKAFKCSARQQSITTRIR
jgi:hypothetical protein